MEHQHSSGPKVVGFRRGTTERAATAQYISTATLELAQQARAAGLPALGHLLESAALTAAADFAAAQWPKDGA